MEAWLCRRNIERFRNQLAEVRDQTQKKTILELLAQEEAKLKRLTSTLAPDDQNQRSRLGRS